MFGWFKKKDHELRPELSALADKLIRPNALAVAIAECVRDYAKAVTAGQIDFPAHRRKNSNVESVWADVRMEAMRPIFGFGRADLMLLADVRKQPELLTAFVDERPHLEFPQPRGEPIADTWQGVWQIYRYLDAVGSEVMDRETDRASLKIQKRDIISNLTTAAITLHGQWAAYESAVKIGSGQLPEMPLTTIEVLWADVTAKTKSIALSTIFGPSYESGIAHMLKLIEEKGTKKEVAMIKASIDRVLAAKEPENIRSGSVRS